MHKGVRLAMAGGVIALLVALAGCGGGASAEGESLDLVYFNGGQGSDTFTQAMESTIWASFTKKGGTVKSQSGDCGISRLEQEVEANNVTSSLWQFCSLAEMDSAISEGLLQPLDPEVFPADEIADGYVRADGLAFGSWTIAMLYDGAAVSGEMTSIADFFDTERFPGKRCATNYPQFSGLFEEAMLYQGAKPKSVYPIDVPAVYKELDRIRGDLVLFDNTAEGSQDLLTGQCAIILNGGADAMELVKENPSRDFHVVQNDGVRGFSGLGIPAHAPNASAANIMLRDMIEDRAAQQAMVETTGIVPFMLAKPLEMPASLADWEGMLVGDGFIPQDETWYQDEAESINRDWNAWVVG
ncbi:extracellular solute-binding protein [Microbacterium gorillae]|uniref:extracellular solute-binding protein n=1 Tax=Microbacterium gorillae TaxID=1231063 RepID=UPI000AA8EC70|nr:extracellular solute-binding protein [Microbacterium gorillae]